VLRFPTAAREHLGEVDYPTLLAYCQPAAELPRPLTPLLARLDGVEQWWTTGQLARADTPTASPRTRRVNHTLRRGQTLATVAEQYHVSPAQLRKWNGLRREQALKPGRQLVVLVSAPTVAPARTSQSMVAAMASPPPTTVATLRQVAPTDSTLLLLAAANARYAHQAQERAARELAQAQELARVKKQLAARAAAQQRLSIAQAAAAAKANAASRLGLPTDSATTQDALVALAPAPARLSSPAARATKRSETGRTTLARQPEQPTDLGGTEAASAAVEDSPTRTTRTSGASSLAEGRAARSPMPDARRGKEEQAESATTTYTVRAGDNLTKLAIKQGVSVAQLKAWNKLTTESVVAGQQLRLAAPADATALPVVAQAPAPRRAKAELPAPRLEMHTVQPGDTLFSIAKRFGLSLQELKRLNHLASDHVKPGQKLVVHS